MTPADIVTQSVWPDFGPDVQVREAEITVELNRALCAPYFDALQDYMRLEMGPSPGFPKDIKLGPGIVLRDVYAISSMSYEPVEMGRTMFNTQWEGRDAERKRQRAMTHVTATIKYLQYERTTDEAPTYHDVVVELNGERMCIFDEPFDLMLTCTRAGGWELWRNLGSTVQDAKLLGGEYGNDDFKITVAGAVICERKKDESK